MSQFESERPYPESPVYGYFHEIRNMTNGERDRIFAINTLCEKITGESAEDRQLRELVYEPGTDKLASLERLATYPIVVFGPSMEEAISPSNAAIEYTRAMKQILAMTSGRHDETCATSGPCVSGEEQRYERYPFCPIMECVDFLSEGMRHFDPDSEQYRLNAWNQYRSVSIRANALINSSRKFESAYQEYLDDYRIKVQMSLFDEEF